MKLRIFIAIASVALASVGQAAVTSQSPTGFTVAYEADTTVTPKAAYDAFVQAGAWWNAKLHSYSGDGKNISIDVKPGGCWCETLKDGGFVRHMTVEHAAPGTRLIFSGGLGPLAYMGVTGHMIVSIEAKGAGSHVKLTYAVGGHDAKDFKDIAKGVDGVLDEAFKRYVNFASTGKP
ncbi:MAG: ATPase [Alphaproteobacteria bacterium]|nr:ATPase [Alphaproteobacteria bacterium]